MRVNKQMKSLIDSHEGGIIIAPDLSVLPDKWRMTMTLLKKRVLSRPFFQYVEAIELPIEGMNYKITEKQMNVITASLTQLTKLVWPSSDGYFWGFAGTTRSLDSRNNPTSAATNGILEPENVLTLPLFRYVGFWSKSRRDGQGKKIEEYMSRFTNALSTGISWGSYFHPSNLQLPSNFANLVSFSIEADCITSETLQAMKNLKSLKDFRFPYSKNIFTETTIFEEICNNHPCIERLEIDACERLVSTHTSNSIIIMF